MIDRTSGRPTTAAPVDLSEVTARLRESTLGTVNVPVPRYERASLCPSVVHLGLGAFARAHLCGYLDELLEQGHRDVSVFGVSLRHDEVARALGPQDGLYGLALTDGHDFRHRVIGSVVDVAHAPSQPERVRAALAARTTTTVTVTVTEKGYCSQLATRRLDHTHADIVHDLAHPDRPRSLLGHLTRAARDRQARQLGGLTVLSLDNIPANGRTLAGLVSEFATALDPHLADWIDDHFRFPGSMVDRIVPATDDRLRATVEAVLGVTDAWPVRAEPFRQWVVERDWAHPMPPLASVGVEVVDDVEPWQRLKLRVVNGLHTAAALYGLAHGLDTIDAVVANPAGHDLLTTIGAEIDEVLVPPPGIRTADYIDATLVRFANPTLGHRCAQTATDTSQKLSQRLLTTLRERRARGLDSDGIITVLALWAWSTLGIDHQGRPRTVDDPLASTLVAIGDRHHHRRDHHEGRDAHALATALIGLQPIFGDLASDPTLIRSVAEGLRPLIARRHLNGMVG